MFPCFVYFVLLFPYIYVYIIQCVLKIMYISIYKHVLFVCFINQLKDREYVQESQLIDTQEVCVEPALLASENCALVDTVMRGTHQNQTQDDCVAFAACGVLPRIQRYAVSNCDFSQPCVCRAGCQVQPSCPCRLFLFVYCWIHVFIVFFYGFCFNKLLPYGYRIRNS